MLTKKDLRITYKTLRNQLSREEVAQKSLAIANALLDLPVWQKNNFHVFLPITRHNEVDTEFLLHLLAGKDKNVLLSRSDVKSREMRHFLLTDNTRIETNQWGIPEPVNGIEVPVSQVEVVFVPLLAFDLSGNRIGYGKGFYDKFLAACPASTIKIGLSFFEAVDTWEDIFESDVKLDYCITPERCYRFG